MKLTVGQVSKMFGVNNDTVRRWEKEGRIKSQRTSGGHRRYEEEDILRFQKSKKRTFLQEKRAVIYVRANNKNESLKLKSDKEFLKKFCIAKDWEYIILEEFGSGLDFSRKGLIKLIELIETNQVHSLIIKQENDLATYGVELLLEICKWHQVDVFIPTQKVF